MVPCMTRALRIGGIVACIGGILLAWWFVHRNSFSASRQTPSVNQRINAAVAFAKNHLTGGIGVILGTDPRTGLVTIQEDITGSPAEKAGLREGDVITKVNGISTKGRPLAQVADDMRGFAEGRVLISIQRAGATNLDLTVYRSSWSSLGHPIFGNQSTNPVMIAPTTLFMNSPSSNGLR
jgi:membrane-associated protease RseP (regulator of RpoE activity)